MTRLVQFAAVVVLLVACCVPLANGDAVTGGVSYDTIQEAIDMAAIGATITIDSGTYRGSGNVKLKVTKEVHLESNSGKANDVVIDCEGASACTVISIYACTDCSMTGITLTGASNSLGGAVFTRSSVVLFTDCVFAENFAVNGGAVMATGDGSRLTFVGGLFTNNRATGGGAALQGENIDWTLTNVDMSSNLGNKQIGLFISGGTLTISSSVLSATVIVIDSADMTVSDSKLTDAPREGTGQGGAILANGMGTMIVEDSYFTNNTATFGSAVYVNGPNNFIFRRNLVEGNRVTARAAVYIGSVGGTQLIEDSIIRNNDATFNACVYLQGSAGFTTIRNTSFTDHYSRVVASCVNIEHPTLIEDSYFGQNTQEQTPGGAVRCDNTVCQIKGTTFEDNESLIGGGAVWTAGLYVHLTINDTKFIKNSAPEGGAIYFGSENTEVYIDGDTVFERNEATRGGALYWDSPNVNVTDRALYSKNEATIAGGVAYYGDSVVRPDSKHCQKAATCKGNSGPGGDEYATAPLETIMDGKTPKKARNLDEIKITIGAVDELGNEVVDDNLQYTAVIIPQDGILVDMEEDDGDSGTPLRIFTLGKGDHKLRVSVVGEFGEAYNVSFIPNSESLQTVSFKTKVEGCDDDDEYEEYYPPGISFFSICKDNNYDDTTSTQDVLAWVYGSIAAFGILVCFVSIVVIILFRGRRVIHYASPSFCVAINFGVIIGFAAIYPFIVEANRTSCNFWPTMFLLSFGLIFSLLIAKIYRIWRLFSNKTMRVIRITNVDLLKFVGVIMTLELACIIVVLAAGQPNWDYAQLDDDDGEAQAHNYVRQCTMENEVAVYTTVAVVNGLILLVAIFLAFGTRGVATGFNDAKPVAIIIYAIAFVAALFIPLIAIKDDHDFTLALAGAGVLGCLWLVWICLFLKNFLVLLSGRDKDIGWSSTFNAAKPSQSTKTRDKTNFGSESQGNFAFDHTTTEMESVEDS
eukprot:TRINITY_DN17040_c0_g1_i1.p1 TRINITY_DN17040_c0_g1~~TRINITY_DN17040_c0_g1_i1.p1  ORF type:complete len:977 (-),score=210.76 TRINITY_DN17040_c0_g1_i1:136-3066(-)